MTNKKLLLPQHLETKAAKKIDTTWKLREITDIIYSNAAIAEQDKIALSNIVQDYPIEDDGRKVFFGEMHGHTVLSDGHVEPDTYFTNLQERVDFCAITDHDHGGMWRDNLYSYKWDKMREYVARYYRPGEFTTILAYERDSYPWYDNMAVYFKDPQSEILECVVKGETNAEELENWLKRDDLFIGPHDTDSLTCSTDFIRRPLSLMPHGFEIISRGDCAEYFDHPLNVTTCVRGGSLQDALAAGAHPAVYAGSDNHDGNNAKDLPERGFPMRYPGMTGVWAKENTQEGIFEALKSRHSYAFMGPERVIIDFRVNDQRMGSIIEESADAPSRTIYFSVESKVPVAKVTVVKNNQDYFITRRDRINCCKFTDYERLLPEDWYYLRVELADGRMAWTSPCWVKTLSE